MEFLIGELLPVEVSKKIVVLLMAEALAEFNLGHAYGLETIRHLRHMAFEDAHRERRRILEQMVRPGKRIRIERISRSPHRTAARGVAHSHTAAAAVVRAFHV